MRRPLGWSGRPPWPALGILVLAGLVPVVFAGDAAPRPDAYIVVLEDGVSRADVPTIAASIVEESRSRMPTLRIAGDDAAGGPRVYRHALGGFAVRVDGRDAERVREIEARPDVAFVAEDRPLELHGQQFQPGMQRIRARRSAAAAINDVRDVDLDVDIAILDTGIDASHPDLRVVQSLSFVAGQPAAGDPHGHGTHVAGIAAAIDDAQGVHGVAPGARLWSLKVMNEAAIAQTSDVIAALDHVAAHADEIDVVNMSLGGVALGDDGQCGTGVGDPLHVAVCGVVDAGVVVVASAGNLEPYGSDASLVSPAAYDEVITVSAVVETDGLGPGAGQGAGTIYGDDNAFAGAFSNYGWDVDLAAPGVEVVSTWPGGSYATQSGTSAAAPHVSGAAALWIAVHGKPSDRLGVMNVREELVRRGFPQRGPDEGFGGDKETFAEPLLNVSAIDPEVFDPVDPDAWTDKPVYELGTDTSATISIRVRGDDGQPLTGMPPNGFTVFLDGVQQDVQVVEQGGGQYELELDISTLRPGDHDLMAVVRNVAGFERSAGCRVLVHAAEPALLIEEFAFSWPVMNHDWFFGSNHLHAKLMDETGAPVAADPEGFETVFSGGGPELVWTPPAPDWVTGVAPGVTYGAFQSVVDDIYALPLGTYHAELTVTHEELSDSATASFDMAYNDPMLSASLTANVSGFDFTQSIAPPPLELTLDVRDETETGVGGLTYLPDEAFELFVDGDPAGTLAFAEHYLEPGLYVSAEVDLDALPHGSHGLVVRVSDARGLVVDSNVVTIDVVRDASSCADPLAAEGQPDGDGDGVRDECDNCPTVSNSSQRNTGPAGMPESELGDACKSRPRLRVSSDLADNPDFLSIQDAVDSAQITARPVEIAILPGLGPYVESVVVDRDQSFRFLGRETEAGPPVVVHDGAGESVFALRSSGVGSIVIRDIVIRGQGAGAERGISVDAPMLTRVSDVRFEDLGTALRLSYGAHRVEHVAVGSSVGTGVLVEDASLTLSYAELRGPSQAVRIVGPAAAVVAEHLLVVGNGITGGIVNDATSTSTLELRHSTIVQCGIALRGNGAATSLSHSILWGNQTDATGVPCGSIAWSNLGEPICGGTNLAVDPLFVNPAGGDFRLQAGSPLVDHGPDPGQFDGTPCTDLAGGPRLRDHDGEGLAQIDPGAYERQNEAILPLEVRGVHWTGPSALEWTPDDAAAEYHVYRALLSTLVYSAFGTCADAIDSVTTDTVLTDDGVPPPGDGFYYEITLEDVPGNESTLGIGTCAERSNFTPCP